MKILLPVALFQAAACASAILLTAALGLSAAEAEALPPPVSAGPIYNATGPVTGVVYGQGLVSAGTSQERVVNLTLDAFLPTQLPGGPALFDSPRPAIMFVHGGAFSGSILGKDKAASITPDVEYFVQRGFVGFQLNYRLKEDNGSWPEDWPPRGRTGGSQLGLQPPIAEGHALAESQRFRFLEDEEGGGSMLALASDPELCVVAKAPGGAVTVLPCPVMAGAPTDDENSTYRWRGGPDDSFVGVGGAFDQKCLGTHAPSTDGAVSYKRAFVGKMAFRCNSSAPDQRWHTGTLASPDGSQICHPSLGTGAGVDPAVDSGCLSFAGGFQPRLAHLYPAIRDAKAAIRWLRAEGPVRFGVDPDYITLAGGSAGACTILGAGICQLPGDYTTEIPLEVDPTIASTYPEESSAVRSMIVHWGAPFGIDAVTAADLHSRSRYQKGAGEAPLPSIIAYNGLVDTTIPIEHILSVQREYAAANGTMVVRPLPGEGHACWDATVVQPQPDGTNRTVSMPEDAFAFIRQAQKLPLQSTVFSAIELSKEVFTI